VHANSIPEFGKVSASLPWQLMPIDADLCMRGDTICLPFILHICLNRDVQCFFQGNDSTVAKKISFHSKEKTLARMPLPGLLGQHYCPDFLDAAGRKPMLPGTQRVSNSLIHPKADATFCSWFRQKIAQ
jgi:hypothetical protein